MAATFAPIPCAADLPAPTAKAEMPSLAPLPSSAFIPTSFPEKEKSAYPKLEALPAWSVYAELEPADFPSWPKPISLLPAIGQEMIDPADFHVTDSEKSETSDFTDVDLYDAFSPIIKTVIQQTVSHQRPNYDSELESMLRATIRRALAEYSPSGRPFHPPGAIDRFSWRMQALFSSRSYSDIVFEKTHRFQVQEVFLLNLANLSLISFASSDPARHANSRRILGTVHRIALLARDENGEVRTHFQLPGGRTVILRQGQGVILAAIVRGQPNDLIVSDLNFTVQRIEERFKIELATDGTPLLNVLQPFLEDCLLIQAPASAA